MTQQTGNDNPRLGEAINRAIELDETGQTSAALQILAKLAVEFPRAASVRAYLAWFSLHAGRSTEAIRHARRAVGLAPTSEKASLVYFHSLWKAGRLKQALAEMKRFLRIHPSNEYSKIIKDWKLDVN